MLRRNIAGAAAAMRSGVATTGRGKLRSRTHADDTIERARKVRGASGSRRAALEAGKKDFAT